MTTPALTPSYELSFRLGAARRSVPFTPLQLSSATGSRVSAEAIVAVELGDATQLSIADLVALCHALQMLPHELCEELEPFYL
jgi:hypothetical protein